MKTTKMQTTRLKSVCFEVLSNPYQTLKAAQGVNMCAITVVRRGQCKHVCNHGGGRSRTILFAPGGSLGGHHVRRLSERERPYGREREGAGGELACGRW
jgi:hypothetical protein